MTFAIKKYITLHIAVRMRKKLLSGIKMLNMDFILAFAEDHVPSTKAFDPYMHLFLDAGQGNVLAFFELPTQPEMGRDENTPQWVQHIAFEVEDLNALLAAKNIWKTTVLKYWVLLTMVSSTQFISLTQMDIV